MAEIKVKKNEQKISLIEVEELNAEHLFAMVNVLKALNLKDVGKLLNDNKNSNNFIVGGVFISYIIENLPKCKEPLFKFLEKISNLNYEQIRVLKSTDFIGLLKNIFQQAGFKDFLEVAKKLL